MSLSARARVRANVIDSMNELELRAFVAKLESAVDNDYTTVDNETLDEWVGEILIDRNDEDDLFGDDL